MERVGFKMKLYQGQVQEYKKRHDEIWPALVQVLKANGISDYSIFFDEETHILFGTLKVESLEKLNELPNHAIMKKWWNHMAAIMHSRQDDSPITVELKEVFYLP